MKPKTHHVKFTAEKKISEPVRVSFERADGTKVSFPAHQKVMEKVLVDFMARTIRSSLSAGEAWPATKTAYTFHFLLRALSARCSRLSRVTRHGPRTTFEHWHSARLA